MPACLPVNETCFHYADLLADPAVEEAGLWSVLALAVVCAVVWVLVSAWEVTGWLEGRRRER